MLKSVKFVRFTALAAALLFGSTQAAYADLINVPHTFSAGQVLTAAELNSNFSVIYNNYNGSISNQNIKVGAAIAPSKLDNTQAFGPILRSTGNPGISVATSGDSFTRVALYTDGSVRFGDGSTSSDLARISYSSSTFDLPLTAGGRASLKAGVIDSFSGSNSNFSIRLSPSTSGPYIGQGVLFQDPSSPGAVPTFGLTYSGSLSTTEFSMRNAASPQNYINLHCGALDLETPLTASEINNSVRRKLIVVPVVNGTIADGTTYTLTVPVGRAGTITAITASIGTAIVGGTSTVAITKNGSTTVLNAATVNPTTFTANTGTALTLTGTPANLDFTATDVIKIVHTAGTQSTDGVAESIAIEYATTDF